MQLIKTTVLVSLALAISSCSFLELSHQTATNSVQADKFAIHVTNADFAKNMPVPEGVKRFYDSYLGCTLWKAPAETLKKYADEGNVVAMYSLGKMYLEVEPFHKEEGMKLLRQAAEHQAACAYMELGHVALPVSDKESFEMTKKAADLGLAQGQFFTGSNYESGIGTPHDKEKAFEYYLKAAKQNDDWSQYSVGTMLEKGIGVEKNPQEAIVWYTKSAQNDRYDAQLRLGQIYFNGWYTPKDYEKAYQYYAPLAEDGYVVAQYDLAQMYIHGWYVKPDIQKAVKLLERASLRNLDEATVLLGDLYAQGKYVKQDLKKARSYYRTACKYNQQAACDALKALNQQKK